MIKIGINGFGRIGRVVLRAILERYSDQIEVVLINASDSMTQAGWLHLLKHDSVYGLFSKGVAIPFSFQRDPALIPWQDFGVQVVLECTGAFRNKEALEAHLRGNNLKVVVSAPAKGVETYVLGVNDQNYQGAKIISNASCTTNCIAPITKIVWDNLGIQKAIMSTAHAVTADQELVDGSNKDWRRARSALTNVVPTSTGAAIAVTEVLPMLKGLFGGLAYRVPVSCGSLADLTLVTTKRTTSEQINEIFTMAAKNQYKNLVQVTEEQLVSHDIIGNPASAIVDLNLTQVIDGDLVKIVAWYDNEYGYSCRLVEMALMVIENDAK
ncbi:MAG: glyceraldehyde 3-phosphate dehydrogenase NAD-binding domain-containing protein [Candidatus Shapirobacteria bacterium]